MSFKWPKMEGIVESLTKTNALYPLLIALFFVLILAVAVFCLTDNIIIQIMALIIVGALIYQILRSYQYFAVNNPDMLRTERHIIQKQVLEILGDEQHTISESAAAVMIATINPTNPIKPTEIANIVVQDKIPKQEDL